MAWQCYFFDNTSYYSGQVKSISKTICHCRLKGEKKIMVAKHFEPKYG